MNIHRDGADIFYTVMGKGPDVVLLHPFPTRHEFWLPVAQALGERYRIILPDLRGHGASTPGDGTATMQKHAADIAAICREAEVTKAVFAGVSIGGYVLFEFWRSYRQHVRALILSNTRAAADTEEGRATRLKSVEEVLQRGPDPFLDSMLPKLIGETSRRNRPDLVANIRLIMQQSGAGIASVQRGMADRPDSIPTLSTIGVPALIIAGEEDVLTPLADAQLMHQAIRGSQLQVIPQAGHFAIQEKADDAVRIIRHFLDRLF